MKINKGIILFIAVLLLAGTAIGASRITIPKPITFGNETTSTSIIVTTTIEPITTTIIPVTKVDWIPVEVRQIVINSAGIQDNPNGGIDLRNGLVIKGISINTNGQNLVIDTTGTSYDLQRESFATLSRIYPISIDPTFNIMTITMPVGVTANQLKYIIGTDVILRLSAVQPIRYGETSYLPTPIADTTLI